MVNRQAAYRCIHHCALFLLQLDNPALNAIFDHQFDGLHRTVLAQPMNSIHGLILDSRVPNPSSVPTNKYVRPRNGEVGTEYGMDGRLSPTYHQLSMRYTLDASVKFSATPPAFSDTKNTVTSTLFTKGRW